MVELKNKADALILDDYADAVACKRDAEKRMSGTKERVREILKDHDSVQFQQGPRLVEMSYSDVTTTDPVTPQEARTITGMKPVELLSLCQLDPVKVRAAGKLGLLSPDEVERLLPQVQSDSGRINVKFTPPL